MQGDNLKNLNLKKIDGLLGNSVASEISRMELHRVALMKAMTKSESLAEQMKKFIDETSHLGQMVKQVKDLQAYSLTEQVKRHIPDDPLAAQVARQWQESQKAEQEAIRRMLDPLQDIRKEFLADSVTKRILDDHAKSSSYVGQMVKLMEHTTGVSAFQKAMQSSIGNSIDSTRKMLADTSVSSSIKQLMKGFEEANKRWVVPQPLLDSLGSLQALHEQLGRLSLPVMDITSAATLARMLGPEGIQAQLVAMGINPDGSINTQFVQQEEGIGLSRKALELMALLSFIFAILIPICQEISSSRWQEATDKTLAAQSNELDRQRKMIEALTKLVEKALVKEAKRQEERFVVLDRVAVVRSKPEHGSAVEGKLLPREVVRPISESGKWIEFEYYHWLLKEHRKGWALKKYFQRVPANFEKPE